MKILTTVRRVPDLDARFELTSDKTAIDTSNLEHNVNYFDEVAVEEAIRLREGGASVEEIISVCIGSEAAQKELRTALAMGADRGIHVHADEGQLDPYVVAQILKGIIDEESPDLVIMGKLGVDYENNQAAQILAGMLNWPQATFAYSTELGDGEVTVGREVDGGTVTFKSTLPAIVTADLRLNEPRFPSLPGIMKAKRKPLATKSPGDYGVDALEPKVRTLRFELPPERQAGVVVETIEDLFAKLRDEVKAI